MTKKKFLMASIVGVLCIVFVSAVKADVNVGMTVTDEGLRNFYFSIGEFFRTPEKEVMVVRQQGIPDEEIAVIYFLSQRANVPPGQIIKWRVHNRWTWMKIASKLKLSPEIFYVRIDEPVTGGVYGRIYKYYQQPRDRWKKIKLTDEEIVHCVNLHFISGYYGYKPVEVIKMRNSGKNFVVINNEIKVKKQHGEKKVIHKKTTKYEKGKHR